MRVNLTDGKGLKRVSRERERGRVPCIFGIIIGQGDFRSHQDRRDEKIV